MNAMYIRGIGSHPPASVWKSQWDLALFGRPMGDQTCGAYWADILHGNDNEGVSSQITAHDDSDVTSLLEDAELDSDNERAAAFVRRLSARLDLPGDDGTESISSLRDTGTEKLAWAYCRCFLAAVRKGYGGILF